MRNYLNIVLGVVSALILLLLPITPHHHHGSEVCFASECCHAHAQNDSDSAHDGCTHQHTCDDALGCASGAKYLTQQNQPHLAPSYHFVALSLVELGDLLESLWSDTVGTEISLYNCDHVPPLPSGFAGGYGLRAPPHMLLSIL